MTSPTKYNIKVPLAYDIIMNIDLLMFEFDLWLLTCIKVHLLMYFYSVVLLLFTPVNYLNVSSTTD